MATDPPDDDQTGQWSQLAATLLGMWRGFREQWIAEAESDPQELFDRLAKVIGLAAQWLEGVPLDRLRPPPGFMEETEALWAALESEAATGNMAPLRDDPRFADSLWREQPVFAFLHQTYLLLCDQMSRAAELAEGIEGNGGAKLQFVLRLIEESINPANFPLTNPLVLARARESGGNSLVRGFGRLLADLHRGQLSHGDPEALCLGEHIAATPGKVIFETPLYQLIQYAPTTARVLRTPLVVFPSWTSRYYLLDLEPESSFVRWTVERGITLFMVSWKSADETLRDVTWDDYISAQLEVMAHVQARLRVPSLHAMGLDLGGTSLAAVLAILAARGEAARVRSATFLATRLDFAEAGERRLLVDDAAIAAIGELSPRGYLDGRYLAALSGLLKPGEALWQPAVRRYLLGEELPPSPFQHWRDDRPNLPAAWLQAHLRDLWRDNLLVEPGGLSLLGIAIDLSRIVTPRHNVDDPCTTSWWSGWLEWLLALDPAQVSARGKRKPGGRGDKAIEYAPGRYVKSR